MDDTHQDYLRDCCRNGDAEGFPPEPPLPKSVRSGAFIYKHDDGFQASGISRAPLEELRLLFRKNASSARRAAATKTWLTAQLRLYGITFDKSAASWQHHAQAVEKHKLDVDQWHKENFAKLSDPTPNKTPEPVILWDLHDYTIGLRRRVDAIPVLSAQITTCLTVIAWAAQLGRGVDTAFAMIDRKYTNYDRDTLEAYFNPDRFLAKYFLDGKREYWVANYHGLERLSQAAKHAPDLLVEDTVKPSPDNAWRCGDCCSEVAQLKVLQSKREARCEKAILAKLKPHIDYVRAHRLLPSGPFTLDHLVGSYIIHCRRLKDEYRDCELGSMTLDIHAPTSTHGAVAAFNFGLVKGTMLLTTSEDSLERLRQEQPIRAYSSDEEDPADIAYYSKSRKRKAAASRLPSVNNFKRRLGGDHTHKPGRFYLQWAGCRTGNSYLVLTEDHERTGHFDLDKSGMTARGQFVDVEHFGKEEPLVFTILKVADKPKAIPDAWSSYCERDRWIRW
ncbi:hypothetical protein HD806DRAFT_552676 [Xylariaceae sp. AK1471]|nr:hypothetical protein HD806DRAFT_552676 [Xylariaceae sp. AK1471]